MVRLLWHPRRENRFVVGGGSQIALYELGSEYPQIRQVISQNDLQFMKCFAWSPHPIDDLFAVGLSTGKVDLIRLEAAKRTGRDNVLASGRPVLSLPQRNSRACNCLAFCQNDLKTLAVGLDKVRGDCSLVLWDIAEAIPSQTVYTSSSSSASDNVLAPPSSRTMSRIQRLEPGIRGEKKIIQQHAPAEVVSTISFLPNSTHLLLAGISHRWLRLFDLRSSTSPTSVASKVQGIATDPFDSNRIACFGDGTATIWDIRKFVQPLLTFTEKDALADGARVKPGATYAEIDFSSTRRGTVATLEKDGSYVRLWDILQANASPSERTARTEEPRVNPITNTASTSKKSWATLPWMPGNASTTAESFHQEAELGWTALWSTRRTKLFSPALASFSLVPSAELYPLTSNVMVVNSTGDLELYAIHDTPKQVSWSPKGDFLIGAGRSLEILQGQREVGANRTTHHDPTVHRRGSDFPLTASSGQDTLPLSFKLKKDKSRSPSFTQPHHRADIAVEVSPPDDTPQHQSRTQAKFQALRNLLDDDMLLRVQRRTLNGYDLNKHDASTVLRDIGIEEESQRMLPDIWEWISHAKDFLSYEVDGYDFSFQGVIGIWEGFSPQDQSKDGNPPTRPGPRTAASHGSKRRSQQLYSDVVGDEKRFQGALQSLIIRREGHRISWKPIVSTSRLPQRHVALRLCGWSFREEDMTNAIERWLKEGNISRAVCWLIFTKKYNEALDQLLKSKDQAHNILSGAFAALLPYGSSKTKDLQAHYSHLAIKLDDPYFRAVLVHLSNGDWMEVLEEESIPFRERLAIALQFLDDKTITNYLRRCLTQSWHIDRLMLTGLTVSGMDVLQNYVDHTSDVQTAAILSSFVHPTRLVDQRADRWLNTYRDLLDSFKLFSCRVNFDMQRGEIIQTAMAKNNVTIPAWLPPPQILIRCNYCSKSISLAGDLETKATVCPHCKRDLPRCAICLLTLGIMRDAAREVELAHGPCRDTMDEAIVICQTCRHGGHASHILEWFMAEDGTKIRDTCPVADCNCNCADEF